MTEKRKNTRAEMLTFNLNTLYIRQCDDYEMRICELADYAKHIAAVLLSLHEDGVSMEEALLAIMMEDIGMGANTPPPEYNSICPELMCGFSSTLSLLDRAMLVSLIAERLREIKFNLSSELFLIPDATDNSVVYVKNSLAEEAYDVFSQELDAPTVSYVQSFKDACHAVSVGDVGYCILPIEERGGGRISGIMSLINDFDLKIASITPVFGLDGNADVKYALLRAGYGSIDIQDEDDLYIEFSVTGDNGYTPAMILSAAERFGLVTYRIGSEYATNHESYLYSFILRGSDSGFVRLLMFLMLFVRDYSVRGIYKNVE